MKLARPAGVLAIIGAVVAIVANIIVFVTPPQVSADLTSYPLPPDAFAVGQVGFALTQLLMGLGIAALVLRLRQGAGRFVLVAAVVAIIGMALTVAGELALIPAASTPVYSDEANIGSAVFGIGVVLAFLGLIVTGISALRRRHERTLATLALIYAGWMLLVVTPASFALGFASLGSLLVIVVADLVIVGIGWRLWRTPS